MRSVVLKIAVLSVILTVQSCMVDSARAKPMPAPTLEEAVRAPLVVIAKYRDYKSNGKLEYFSPPVARYDLVRPLRGSLAASSLSVSYQFQDGSACLPVAGWEFKKNLMPEPGSKWILFLDTSQSGAYYTYRGDFGRMPATDENLKKIESLMKTVPAAQLRKLANY